MLLKPTDELDKQLEQMKPEELHRIIENKDLEDADLSVNITPEVIAALESYGYKVIRPEKNERNSEQTEE